MDSIKSLVSAAWVLSAAAAVFGNQAVAGTVTVNATGDSPAAICPTTCTLRKAITIANAGDTVVFTPGLFSPIGLLDGLTVDKFLHIQGPGAEKLTVTAYNANRTFTVSAQVTISGVTIADGAAAGSTGAQGGEVTGGGGGPGGPGGLGFGGCVLVENSGILVLNHVAVHHCRVYGGSGGTGGVGAGAQLGGYSGGPGGPGGPAQGAGVFVYGSLTLVNSSIVDGEAFGGGGGAGGNGGFDAAGGGGGNGGSAEGGALYVAAGAYLHIENSTIAASTATGGNGGTPSQLYFLGAGGNGGDAKSGLVGIGSSVALADIEFSTLANGQVVPGSGSLGLGGRGQSGNVTGGTAISAASATNVLSSVVVGHQAGSVVCDGAVAAVIGSINLSEDASCPGFTLHAPFVLLFQPVDVNATSWPGFMPRWHSTVTDAAADCNDIAVDPVADDEHDTPRPQGSKCDLGAIEADYIFVDGVE